MLGFDRFGLRFDGAGCSDVGLVRDQNEDSAFFSPYLALVADGVGGAAAGEIASATAAYAVSSTVSAGVGERPVALCLATGARSAQAVLAEAVRVDPRRAGMATTMTALATDGERLVLGHVGDSRCYRLRSDELVRISTDHTYVQSLVDGGRLPAAGARTHPWRNVVLRSMDGHPSEDLAESGGLDLVELEVCRGDRFLVCSDGLTDLVPDGRVSQVLAEVRDPLSAASRLVADARSAGGTDNITALVLDLVQGPHVVPDGQCFGALAEDDNVFEAPVVRASS